MGDPDLIWLGAIYRVICFPVSHVNFSVGGSPKSIAKLDGSHGRIFPTLDPPLIIEAQRLPALTSPTMLENLLGLLFNLDVHYGLIDSSTSVVTINQLI